MRARQINCSYLDNTALNERLGRKGASCGEQSFGSFREKAVQKFINCTAGIFALNISVDKPVVCRSQVFVYTPDFIIFRAAEKSRQSCKHTQISTNKLRVGHKSVLCRI